MKRLNIGGGEMFKDIMLFLIITGILLLGRELNEIQAVLCSGNSVAAQCLKFK